MLRNYVHDIRSEFADMLERGEFVTDKGGQRTIEIINASFIADEKSIFGVINEDYVKRELEWYRSLSLCVNDIPGGAPAIWKQVADKYGRINSNYGWCIYSADNHHQFVKVVDELVKSPLSRRATMIYIRPTMHEDYCRDGMSDFMCTYSTQYYIRNGLLHASVFMRSNDAVYGYKNDYAWQHYVHKEVLQAVNGKSNTVYGLGDMHWNAGSLHVYERHFDIVNEWKSNDDDKYA